MSDPHDPFEQHLAAEMEALVAAERAPADLVVRARATATRAHRARRRGVLGGAAVLVAAAVWVLVIVAFPGDDTTDVDTVIGATSSSSLETTSSTATTSSTEALIDPGATSTTRSPSSTIQAAPEPKCVEITNEVKPVRDDWAAYWQTKPEPNRPISMRACIDDVTPRVGQLVTVRVVADDPDAIINADDCAVEVFWEQPAGSLCHDTAYGPPAEPEPTPAPVSGHRDRSSTHAYASAGPKVMTLRVISGPDERTHPYASYITVDIPIVVHD